jgi:hypothetical protein
MAHAARKDVYLHAGARQGARALGLDVRRGFLPVTAFPKPLRSLSADDIEDFLRIYKKKLAALMAAPSRAGAADNRVSAAPRAC